jgi:tetratricopeptide (TPR) repeat protein
MSLPTQTDEPNNGVSPQSDKRATQLRPRGIRPLTWILLLAIIGPCAVQFVPQEIGRWHLARAIRLRESGQKEAAYQELAAALERFPNDPSLLLRRAEWQLADGNREEALAVGQQAQALAKDEPGILMKHAELLQKAGEFEQAIESWKLVEEFSRRSGHPPREEALNGLAYSQALAKIELDDALRNVTAAIDLLPSEEPKEPVKRALQVLNRAQLLDTRGYILHLLGRNEQAITDMDDAVNALSQAHRELGLLIKSKADKSASPSSKEAQLSFSDARSSAVIHYHRSLVLKALDRKDDAEKDIETVRKLIGREPDETLF